LSLVDFYYQTATFSNNQTKENAMGSIPILLCGMIVVMGGILLLRMHAFLALILGALVVASLTPAERIFESEIVPQGIPVAFTQLTPSGNGVGYSTIELGIDGPVAPGAYTQFRRNLNTEVWESVGTGELTSKEVTGEAGVTEYTYSQYGGADVKLIQPGDLLVSPAVVKTATSVANKPLGDRIAMGFGKTCLDIGILIAMASIVGECLLNSGAAQRVVVSTRRAFGEDRSPWAFLVSGFIVGIPVFFDTVFLLLMPLGKAMRMQTGKNYLLYILSIVAGGTMAHSLVPPTPGPLLVASELGVSIGAMIIGGTIVGFLASLAGYAYAVWANKRWNIPLRDSVHTSPEELAALSHQDVSKLPPLWLSLAPIFLPVIFIAGQTTLEYCYEGMPIESQPAWVKIMWPAMNVLGHKNIALIVAAAIGLFTMAWHKRSSRKEMTDTVQAALSGGAVIILITAAGGSFGMALKQTNIAGVIQEMVPPAQAGAALLFIAFFVTAVIRVAQGSATVAMITAVGIVGPLATTMNLPYHPLYLALAVGCGSKPLPWMNDSGFWVIGKMSGMTEAEMLKSVTVMMTIMGIVGMALTLLGAWLVPLV
jgi:gluconate:H+ symporter, GntP family